MRRMILACSLTGMALLFGAAPTPGLAGEAGVQFVGYRHGSYYCDYRNALPIITAVTTRNAAVITSIMTATHKGGGGGYYYKKRYYGGGGY